jgi:predicted Zn-ribbon and HTH transcriptional regulator
MPPKSTIELSEGRLYFNGLYEPLEVVGGSVTDEAEWADDQKPYIKNVLEPVEFTIDNVEFAREWVLAECKECGYKFPVTEFYALLWGTKGWVCPKCALKKVIEDARKRAAEKES